LVTWEIKVVEDKDNVSGGKPSRRTLALQTAKG
jgi:hypothetical protein